ncbi:hypothetical protein ACA910_014887 [Epithemia clementina (nom. ined.)]
MLSNEAAGKVLDRLLCCTYPSGEWERQVSDSCTDYDVLQHQEEYDYVRSYLMMPSLSFDEEEDVDDQMQDNSISEHSGMPYPAHNKQRANYSGLPAMRARPVSVSDLTLVTSNSRQCVRLPMRQEEHEHVQEQALGPELPPPVGGWTTPPPPPPPPLYCSPPPPPQPVIRSHIEGAGGFSFVFVDGSKSPPSASNKNNNRSVDFQKYFTRSTSPSLSPPTTPLSLLRSNVSRTDTETTSSMSSVGATSSSEFSLSSSPMMLVTSPLSTPPTRRKWELRAEPVNCIRQEESKHAVAIVSPNPLTSTDSRLPPSSAEIPSLTSLRSANLKSAQSQTAHNLIFRKLKADLDSTVPKRPSKENDPC